jgi:hypothetical protein
MSQQNENVRFVQSRNDRVCVKRRKENLQLKITRPLEGGNDFVSYIDAIGELDGKRCLIHWSMLTSRSSSRSSFRPMSSELLMTLPN